MANKLPGAIDWTIIPDVSEDNNDYMDIDPPLDEWEDIIEEGFAAEGGHKEYEQMAALITYEATFILLLTHFLIQL
jgi:hypothetical protein